MILWSYNSCPLDLQLSEKGKPYVDIQGLTAATMEILLDFVYTETVHVTVENVQELLPAACLLQLKGTDAAVALVTPRWPAHAHMNGHLTYGVVETWHSGVQPGRKVRFQSWWKGTSPGVSVALFRTGHFHQFCVLKNRGGNIHAPQGNRKLVLSIASVEGTRHQVGRDARGLFGVRPLVPLIF